MALAFTLSSSGCATRSVRKSIIDRGGIEVDLVREVKGFAQVQPQGYEHPAIISAERMRHILAAVEVETREESGGTIRQPAFHPDILDKIATEMAAGFAEANPDQALGVKAVRKQVRAGIFHKKFLTSLLADIKDGYLVLALSRIDWLIPKNKENDKLPEPIRGQAPMTFRVVAGEHLFYAGPQTLEIAWQDPVFRSAYRLPGTTSGQKRRREILSSSDVPKDELDSETGSEGSVGLEDLSPEQLRALADLEEDRRSGRITETAYQRARRQIFRQR